jgi:very-short-patch-repair endonuclease
MEKPKQERIRGKGKDTIIDQDRWAILVAEYDYDNNVHPLLDSYGPCSNKSVQWICPEKGHRYEAAVNNRYKGTRCSYCYGKKVGADNCLAATHPEIAAQWHPTLNDKTPSDIKAGCNTKYWWMCERGHEWDAAPNTRTKGKGTGCRHCTGKTTADGNTLAAKFPEIAAEWSPKNTLKPDEVTPKCTKNVWWTCPKGHEYEAMIGNRTAGTGCSFCAGKKVCEDNSFATHYPELAVQWHPTKNEKSADTVSKSSGESAWWVCEKGHEWPALITNRIKGHNCPFCSGRYPSPENNLAICHSHLVKEWHPTKNIKSPFEFTPTSHHKVWWVCQFNPTHEWEAKIGNRTVGMKTNCPICCKSKLELATYNTLRKLGVDDFKSEHIFADLKEYRYDFYVPSWRTLIECDGIQHFENHSKFYAARVQGKTFEEQQESDRIKTKYAIDNGINIIRIGHNQVTHVEEILTKYASDKVWESTESKMLLFPEKLYTPWIHSAPDINERLLKDLERLQSAALAQFAEAKKMKASVIEHV